MMTKHIVFHVAEYIRLSREDGDKAESDSVGNQRKLITDFLKGKDEMILYDTYVDDGYTGTNFSRPSFLKMLADIEAGKVNCVIVKDLSRFGRDYIDTGKYLERYFPDHHVRFISITDNIDSFKQTYDMLLPIKNIFNEQYARDISKKVHASIKTKQKAGEFIGAFASYGYRKSPADRNSLIIDEYAAGIVQKIFQMYISGTGKSKIAMELNKEGIVCPSEYKKLNGENYKNCHRLEATSYWTYSTVNRLLQNQMYAGNMVQGKKTQHMRSKQRSLDKEDWIIVENTHEAIIDKDTWEKAQRLLLRRTRSLDLNTNVSIFAGFLKCGDCGRSLVKKVSKSGNGKDVIHYYCGTYVRSGRQYCTPHPISHLFLEKIILDDLRVVIRSMGNLEQMVHKNLASLKTTRRTSDCETNRLRAELCRVQNLKKSIYEDYRDALISKEEFVAYRQDYLKKEELLTKQLKSIEQRPETEAAANGFESLWVKRLFELRSIETLDRNIVVEMLDEVRVYKNHKVKISYLFSKEASGHYFPQ